MEDRVILLGGKTNPYPYIANANLHVCTSLSESWSYTVNEANVLGVPSVSTDFGAAYESIQCDASMAVATIESLHSKIANLIADRDQYAEIVKRLMQLSYDNRVSMDCILSLFD